MNDRRLNDLLSRPLNTDETWQGGLIHMSEILDTSAPDWANESVFVLWCSTSTGLAHAKPFLMGDKSRLECLVEVMLELAAEHDFPFCPARIECNDRELADGLRSLLKGSGTSAGFVADMPQWDELLNDFTEHLGPAGPPIESLLDAGCTEQQIREFAKAAAAYYRAGLWDCLEDVDLIKIESPQAPQFLKYAVVLGAASQTYGLGFYDDAEEHYDMMAQDSDPRDVRLFSVTFDSLTESAPSEVEMWHELDLPLESGDAFPFFCFYSQDGPRRPTPKELVFATVVLQALAATSEEEIDSGRWTKSVECLGSSNECVLSIPDLLDPPDHEEWMRRGMMPEGRGHEHQMKLIQEYVEQHGDGMSLEELNEEINARFSGPIDDLDYPMDTPADRAEAYCQQAINAFGRRRIQLVRQALAEDPMHVEANVLLAESTRRAEDRIKAFRNAKEVGKKQLGAIMEEAVGHFWGLTETRPFMRACHGLAEALAEDGQANEAIEQYQEMLRLNPDDNQGVRYAAVSLLLLQNRDPEAIELLDAYREETAHWLHLRALAEFRRGGSSATARKAIKSAFRANEHVIDLIRSSDPLPVPDFYSPGSPEEAAICVDEMLGAWAESEGYVVWMSHEFARFERDKKKRLRDRMRKDRGKAAGRKRRRP